MVCKNHANSNGVNTCSHCGQWLCDDCSVEVTGRIICKQCVAELMRSGKSKKIHHNRDISKFLLFIFSAIPGANYMYLGLMKKGFLLMFAFFTVCFSNMGSFEIFIPVLFFYSFFAGFNIRRKIYDGEIITDDFGETITFFANHKAYIIGILAILLFANPQYMLRNFTSSYLNLGSLSDFIGYSVIAILALIVIVVLKNRNSKPKEYVYGDENTGVQQKNNNYLD